MEIKWIAIDDEPLALELIQNYASRIPCLTMLRVFDDAISGAEFLKNNKVDLLLLDINMPDINGIDLLKSIEDKPITIFTTAYKKFAFEGFELEAMDYLLKPFDFSRFEKAIGKVIEFYKLKTPAITENAIFVKSEYQLLKIDLDKIEYIESAEDYLKIHQTTGYPILTLMTVKAMVERLPPDRFMRIHRSYVVPLQKIKSLNNRKVKMTTVELPVSNSYIDELKKQISV